MGNISSKPEISVVIPALVGFNDRDHHALLSDPSIISIYNSASIYDIYALQNEEKNIQTAIESARRSSSPCEIIVVDGGSQDNTVSIAKKSGAIVAQSNKGRARQMNIGADIAQGNILLFLHADNALPDRWDQHISNALHNNSNSSGSNHSSNDDDNNNTKSPSSSWGCFKTIQIDASPLAAWSLYHAVSLRTHLFHKPYGDQGLFMYKSAFEQSGRYPSDWPLLEDVALVESLKRKFGAPSIIPLALETSARRWKEVGFIKTTMINQAILIGHALGVDVGTLSRMYYNNNNTSKRKK